MATITKPAHLGAISERIQARRDAAWARQQAERYGRQAEGQNTYYGPGSHATSEQDSVQSRYRAQSEQKEQSSRSGSGRKQWTGDSGFVPMPNPENRQLLSFPITLATRPGAWRLCVNPASGYWALMGPSSQGSPRSCGRNYPALKKAMGLKRKPETKTDVLRDSVVFSTDRKSKVSWWLTRTPRLEAREIHDRRS